MRTDFQHVLIEYDESVVTITMNRPDVLNAINALMLEELTEAVETAAHTDAIRCVLLTGAGRAFGADQDLTEFSAAYATADHRETVDAFLHKRAVTFTGK
jgi:2-(1,2-epoxy-1,2-dihydrophenyl)acetyl-CoA isomerase